MQTADAEPNQQVGLNAAENVVSQVIVACKVLVAFFGYSCVAVLFCFRSISMWVDVTAST